MKILLLLITCCAPFISANQNSTFPGNDSLLQGQIVWRSFEELNTIGNEDKKVMVFIYTDWCKWCRELDKTCFSDSDIANFINLNYFPIKFNGEIDESIEFQGQTYKLKKEDEKVFHQFTEEFNKGDISYPAIVFLDENLKVIQTIKGFRPKSEMFNVLNYFEGNYYKKVSWTNYIKSLQN